MRYLIAALGLIGLLAVLAGLKASQISMMIDAGKQMQQAGPPPEVVSTAVATQQTWEETLSAVASVVSARGVALSNDAAGVVSRLHFESGASVRAGQTLVELDTGVERAQLESTRARREFAELSLNRSRALVGSGVGTQAQVDTDASSVKSLSADLNALEAQIARKIIRAPFAGKLGIRTVNLGQYLAPGTTIVELESTQSVFVDFTLPQQHLPELKVGMLVRALEAIGSAPPMEGTISAIEPAVDARTRAVKVRASLPNQQDRLRPGMFVRVAVVLPERGQVVAVPSTAIIHASYGDSTFVVDESPGGSAAGKPGKVARQQFVRLGETRGDFVSVLDGVKPGEEVVVAGGFKLRNGASLLVNNESVKLEPKLEPRPENR